MLEFALVLPILLALVCGIIDFGWLFYNKSELNNCAREGARYAVVHAFEDAAIEEKVNNIAPLSIKPLDITITYPNDDVTIVLTSEVKVLTPLTGIFVKNQKVTLTAQVTMKVEQ